MRTRFAFGAARCRSPTTAEYRTNSHESLHQTRRTTADGNPVRVVLIGAGKFSSMSLAQARRLKGIHVVGIADLNPEGARSNVEPCLCRLGGRAVFGGQSRRAAKSGGTHVGEDAAALIAHPATDIVIECAGNPIAAVDHILVAIREGKHVINVTVEVDAFVGFAFAEKARQAGIVYSMAYGDQPTLICDLVDWARACGFDVVAASRGHKWRPAYRQSTPNTVWEPTGAATSFNADCVAVAKRHLKTGEMLDGEGGYTLSGGLRPAKASFTAGNLPLGLAQDVTMKRDVPDNTVLTWEDVEMGEKTAAYRLRREMEALLQSSAASRLRNFPPRVQPHGPEHCQQAENRHRQNERGEHGGGIVLCQNGSGERGQRADPAGRTARKAWPD